MQALPYFLKLKNHFFRQVSGSGSLECSIFILLLNFSVSIHFTHTMHIFFYHRASSFTATHRGQPSGTRGPPTCFKRCSWALHIGPVYTGAAPCSPFWCWWRCWWTHQRPIFNILGSSLQRVLPWRQYLCTFPTHSQVSRLRSIPDTWPYSDSRSCSDWNHSYTTEPVLHQRQCWSMTFSCTLHPSKDKSPRQHYRISVRYQRGT